MLNSKKVTIGGKDVLVTEVKVGRVLKLMPFLSAGQKSEGDEAEVGFMENLDLLLKESCGLKQEDFGDMHGSEIEELWLAFREVNGFFFRTLASLGLEETIANLLNTTLAAYGGMFANLLSGATQDASITDLAGLLQQSETPNGSAGQE